MIFLESILANPLSCSAWAVGVPLAAEEVAAPLFELWRTPDFLEVAARESLRLSLFVPPQVLQARLQAALRPQMTASPGGAGASSVLPKPSSAVPPNYFYRHWQASLRKALLEGWNSKDLLRELMGSLPRNAFVVLERIKTEEDVSPRFVQTLAQNLGVNEKEARHSLQLWLQLVAGEWIALCSKEEWELPRGSLQDLLHRRLELLVAKGVIMNPEHMAMALAQAPFLVRETFLNAVVGVRDVPRIHANQINPRHRIVTPWEHFWEEEAKRWGWPTKPKKIGRFSEILMGMKYAKQVGWEPQKFLNWLDEEAERSGAQTVARLFTEAVDVPCLLGKKKRPAIRERLFIMRDRLGKKSVDEWIKSWERFAREMGWEKAIRPIPASLQEGIAHFMQGIVNKEPYYKKAARLEPAKRGRWLVGRLRKEGLLADAAVVESILGLDGPVQKTLLQISKEVHLPLGTLSRIRRKHTALAKRYGLTVVERKQRAQNAASAGGMIKVLRRIAKQGKETGWTLDSFRHFLREDPEWILAVGEKHLLLVEIFEWHLRSFSDDDRSPSAIYNLAFKEKGLHRSVFSVWWNRFSEWHREFGLK